MIKKKVKLNKFILLETNLTLKSKKKIKFKIK